MKPELESLTNRMWQLQRLQEEGHNVTPQLEETWDQIADIIHGEDEVKLKNVRERIQDIIKEEVHHEQEGWCAPACIQFIAQQEGLYFEQTQLAQILETSHEEGTSHEHMLSGAKRIGLKCAQVQGQRIDALAEVLPEYYVVVNWMDGPNNESDGHYSIMKSVENGIVNLQDGSMKIEEFERKWYDLEMDGTRIDRWAMIIKRDTMKST